MGKNLDKFRLLMWKNFLLQRRHPIQTAVEILIPTLITSLLVALRATSWPTYNPAILFTAFENDPSPMIQNQQQLILAYSPKNPALEKIMKDTATVISQKANESELQLFALENSEMLQAFLSNNLESEVLRFSFVAGVQFDDSLAGSVKLTPHMNVTIRLSPSLPGYQFSWQTDALYPAVLKSGPRLWYSNEGADPKYYEYGFLLLQQEVSYSIISHFKDEIGSQSFDRKSVPIYMQRFPYPKSTHDVILETFQVIVGPLIMLSFLYTCINTVKVITTEKEKQLKETMKIMGLPGWLHWTAWFIKTFTLLFITVTIMVIVVTVRWYPNRSVSIFTHSNPLILFLFLMLYICATITFCFALSVFFSKANSAAVIATLAWLSLYFPHGFAQMSYKTLSLSDKLLGSLCSNSAMAYGFQLIFVFEIFGEGIQWNNIWTPTTLDDELVLGHLIIMLIVDTLLYLLIALYVEAVFPGEYGVPQVWYFPFTRSYWCKNRQAADSDPFPKSCLENEFYEKEPTHLDVGIKIHQLRKEFSRENVAVKDLSLNLYRDQITVLLGHNGAGKTTTMSMLTGMFPPSSGTAVVEGYDIRTNISEVQDSLGFCPQHNILFDDLTTKEHLYFYGRLKGLEKEDVKAEINKFIELLELTDKGDARPATLSGGMKRKLSVAIALCGGSRIVMCDEPSSGMDPSARRALWDLLQSQKKGRTILLTTHFMDEADLLGDRIAIMREGQLQCCGSSYFLKKKYSSGYRLIMEKSSACVTEHITELLQKYIPNVKFENNIGSELTYTLSEEYLPIFQDVLSDLEAQSAHLGILSYGISLTSFDEVFIKANADRGHKFTSFSEYLENNNGQFHQQNGNRGIESQRYHESADVKVQLGGDNFLTGWTLWWNQVYAMFMKRGLSILRSWPLSVLQICISVAFIIASIAIIRSVITVQDLPILKIELDSYRNPVTVVSRDSENKYAEQYVGFLNNNDKELVDWKDMDVLEKMLEETKRDISAIRTRYLTGATFWENNSVTAWFNNDPYHTPPLTLQLVINALLRTEISPDHTIQVYSHPLPFPAKSKIDELRYPKNSGLVISLMLSCSMAIVSAFYVPFYVRERISNAKHLQFVAGANIIVFWGSAFICDLITYILSSLFIIITFAALQEDGYSTTEDLSNIFLILLYYGFSMLPLIYLASFIFKIPATGYTRMVLFNIMAGVLLFIVMYLFEPLLEEIGINDLIHTILLVIPLYSFCTGMRDMNAMYTTSKACNDLVQICINGGNSTTPEGCSQVACAQSDECCSLHGYYSMSKPGIGKNVLISFITGVLLIVFLLGIEYRIVQALRYKICSRLPTPISQDRAGDDSDVFKEQEKIRNASSQELSSYDVVMKDVTKYYKKLLAVNNLCIGINNYECFGLLGVNGAGKTTTFKMMTGEIQVSSGNAWIKGLNLKTDMKEICKSIGYCPQFDALLDNLTCRETIQIFSLLRGISAKESKSVVEKLSIAFDFHQHLNKKVKQLSGGNKRKLSTAIALIGNPPIVYLDEPTTGMDPASKRLLWRTLCTVRDSGKCIVLTSHSMEECEALCTRLAIMVNGAFVCLGSPQHLKSKYSDGYTLTIKARIAESSALLDAKLADIEKFVKNNFGNTVARERHQEMMTFYVPTTSQPWSKIFGMMEEGKRSLDIEDYSLGQSSLEQVFLSFTKYDQVE